VAGRSGLSKLGKKARWYVVDDRNPKSFGARARAKRWALLEEHFGDLDGASVLDLGGHSRNWVNAPLRPASVTVLNRSFPDGFVAPDWFELVEGDACDLPDEVRTGSYDLVFSNSVIEHVGDAEQRAAFAASVRSIDAPHWIQTPNRSFPIEPHWLFPYFPYLPFEAKVAVSRYWPAVRRRPTRESAIAKVENVHLLDVDEMVKVFPDSEIVREKALGLTKSLIAVRR
jgi:Methyltransferase domain